MIRRELRLSEGDAFNRVLLDRAGRDVRGLGYFGEVEVNGFSGQRSLTRLLLTVVGKTAKPVTEFRCQLFYRQSGDQFGISGVIFWDESQRLQLQFGLSNQVNRYVVGFTEPHFWVAIWLISSTHDKL